MHEIDKLRQLDLNLLVVFAHLARTLSVSATARALGRSQSAVSHALARLRVSLDDNLLLRHGNQLVPTPRALRLQADLSELLPQLAAVVVKPATFSPELATTTFRVIASDLMQWMLIGPLSVRLASLAPGIRFQTLPYGGGEATALADGSADLWLSVPAVTVDGAALPSRTSRTIDLFTETFLGVARAKHPLLRRRMTLARYAAVPHVLVTPRGRSGSAVDSFLAQHGLSRRIELELSTFLPVGDVIAGTDRLVSLPRPLALRLVRDDRRLRTFELPFRSPQFVTRMEWAARTDGDAAQQWLRSEIQRQAALLTGGR